MYPFQNNYGLSPVLHPDPIFSNIKLWHNPQPKKLTACPDNLAQSKKNYMFSSYHLVTVTEYTIVTDCFVKRTAWRLIMTIVRWLCTWFTHSPYWTALSDIMGTIANRIPVRAGFNINITVREPQIRIRFRINMEIFTWNNAKLDG